MAFIPQKYRENGGREALEQFLADFGKNLNPDEIANIPLPRNNRKNMNTRPKAESARR